MQQCRPRARKIRQARLCAAISSARLSKFDRRPRNSHSTTPEGRSMRLTDKVSIITGAGQGIGRATALKFAAEGAKVAVCDINPAAVDDTVHAIREAGGEAAGYVVDVTDKDSIARMVAGVMAKWARIDTLVNNAGIVQDAQFK